MEKTWFSQFKTEMAAPGSEKSRLPVGGKAPQPERSEGGGHGGGRRRRRGTAPCVQHGSPAGSKKSDRGRRGSREEMELPHSSVRKRAKTPAMALEGL